MMAMKQHLSWILMAGLATAHLVGSAESSPSRGADRPSPAAPMPEAGLTREQRIQWWREARFGMFIPLLGEGGFRPGLTG